MSALLKALHAVWSTGAGYPEHSAERVIVRRAVSRVLAFAEVIAAADNEKMMLLAKRKQANALLPLFVFEIDGEVVETDNVIIGADGERSLQNRLLLSGLSRGRARPQAQMWRALLFSELEYRHRAYGYRVGEPLAKIHRRVLNAIWRHGGPATKARARQTTRVRSKARAIKFG